MLNHHCFLDDLLDNSSLRFSFLSAKAYVEMLVPQRQILRAASLHCYMHSFELGETKLVLRCNKPKEQNSLVL